MKRCEYGLGSGNAAATIQVGRRSGGRFFNGWRAPRPALDLMLLGAVAYCVDKATLRAGTSDQWTRDLAVELPVADPAPWTTAEWAPVLNFLTGDRWDIRPYAETRSPLDGLKGLPEETTPVGEIDAVCLFSGGLDSLTGVVDLLEEDADRRLCLLSHHEGDQASTAQQALLAELQRHYGAERLVSRRLFLRPAPVNQGQARPLPALRENSTRARSLLFLSVALGMAASVSPTTPVYIPENGFIGINVPLTRARSGSYEAPANDPPALRGSPLRSRQDSGDQQPDRESVPLEDERRDSQRDAECRSAADTCPSQYLLLPIQKRLDTSSARKATVATASRASSAEPRWPASDGTR